SPLPGSPMPAAAPAARQHPAARRSRSPTLVRRGIGDEEVHAVGISALRARPVRTRDHADRPPEPETCEIQRLSENRSFEGAETVQAGYQRHSWSAGLLSGGSPVTCWADPVQAASPHERVRWQASTQGRVRAVGLYEDPCDPEVILGRLPEQERAEFLRQYQEAVLAARDPAGYKRLRQVLHVWSLAVIATSGPSGCSRLGAAAGGGTSPAAVTYRAELSSRALGQLGGLLERRLMLSWPPCPGGSSTSMIRYGR